MPVRRCWAMRTLRRPICATGAKIRCRWVPSIFDLVFSCLAMHHLDGEGKRDLFRFREGNRFSRARWSVVKYFGFSRSHPNDRNSGARWGPR